MEYSLGKRDCVRVCALTHVYLVGGGTKIIRSNILCYRQRWLYRHCKKSGISCELSKHFLGIDYANIYIICFHHIRKNIYYLALPKGFRLWELTSRQMKNETNKQMNLFIPFHTHFSHILETYCVPVSVLTRRIQSK